jgi:hypothetical protein
MIDHPHDPFDVPFDCYFAATTPADRVADAAGWRGVAREAFTAGALWCQEDAQARSACYDPWHAAPRVNGKLLACDAGDLPDEVKVAALQAARDVREDDWDDTWDETALAVLGAVWPLALASRDA